MAFYRGGNNVGRGSLPWEEDFWEDCSWCIKSCAGEKKETETEEERERRERQIVKLKKAVEEAAEESKRALAEQKAQYDKLLEEEKEQIAKEKRQFEAKRQMIFQNALS